MYDIFKIDSGTKLDKAKMDTTDPKINFVGRSNFNNGITQQVNEIRGLKPYDAGNLTLALGGAYLGSCFIQEEPFIATAIFKESQNNYRAFIRELNAHIKKGFVIKLPALSDGNPDYDYMSKYIRDIQKRTEHLLSCLMVS